MSEYNALNNTNQLTGTRMRAIARDWFSKQETKDGRVILQKPGNQRQFLVTPFLAKLVPPVYGTTNDGNPLYCTSYEIEIRSDKATVRLMIWRNHKTPQSITGIYRKIVPPMTKKDFRENFKGSSDEQTYNTTFGSISVDASTTESDLTRFFESVWDNILRFEEDYSYLLEN